MAKKRPAAVAYIVPSSRKGLVRLLDQLVKIAGLPPIGGTWKRILVMPGPDDGGATVNVKVSFKKAAKGR